ncbi:extracellular matrix organizing protein FRAS1-like [Entelurus aequoreus]|uniref:extracellular matrix organizing protein FRAS1-like n=1 Tax=Entelurus aequoreus TaxID=161455 RepID=UPI002B1E2365|nr:extracellular matrix organizing protein FRAS1-like [Entelurus aequoreus]
MEASVCMLVCVLTAVVCAHGACVYEGSLHANASSWQPQPCEECRCHDKVVVCLGVSCAHPQCQEGERLRINAGQCCPGCVPSSEDSCDHQGVTYADGSQWSPTPCLLCECSSGVASCAPPQCPPLACPDFFTPAGECCPQCGLAGESCSWQDSVYQDGEEWRPGPCSRCVCHDGDAHCSVAECPPATCKPNENLVIPPGRCCPVCVSNTCLAAGKEYQNGEQWQKDACTTCVCDHGQSKCHTHTCRAVTCEKGQSKMRRAEQCCEECAATRGRCRHQGLLRYHGDTWNAAGCEFCSCSRGQVLCRKAECGRVDCPQGSHLRHLPGLCCPQCSSQRTSCLHQGQVHQDATRWSPAPCRQCECGEGHVTCYLQSCPTCPPGTLGVTQQGGCCPRCQQVRCHADCRSCLGSPDHCQSCKDPGAVLHLGRCLSACPDGFFADGAACAACPPSCSVCSSRRACRSCALRRPLLSADGSQCLTSCPAGNYQDQHGRCQSCSESCSECGGPSPQECWSCSDPAALLQDGGCVLHCGATFYTQDGVCHPCHSSCASCFHDNPNCTSCLAGSALHHGTCVSQCPARHFLDHRSRCRVCHSTCASCWGVSASQCTTCAPALLLHQGQCVHTCGQGLYPHTHTCHNCHPSCRSCVGPLASDCVRCLKAEEAMAPQSRGLPHGVCTADCPARSFLDGDHTCTECHPSCWVCVGPSVDDCTSCPSPAALLQGRCVPSCPPGFFLQDSQCQSCHPSCQTCSGPSQAACTSCPPEVWLQSGSCRSSCQEGHFLAATTAECLRCNMGCERCTADLQTSIGSVCLWCKEGGALLLGDHCVPRCAPDHYSQQGACLRCHASCESCRGAGPLACTSCHAPNVLLPSGVCAARCPLGYHDNGHGVCQACEHQCLRCDAGGSCTSCRDPAKVLQFGECQYDTCAQQYFLNATTRTCTECDWSCNACTGPQPTDCSQCMEGHVLHDGVCTHKCPPGWYQDGDTCLGCDDLCMECDGPAHCLRCQPPHAILRGRCVLRCGRGYFLDAHACQPCSTDCSLCDDVGRCRACAPPAYLMEGYCTPACGHGYYADRQTRRCHANSSPPFLHVNGSLLVPLGGSVPLGPTLLPVQDQDSPPQALVFRLVRRPANGRLVVLGDEEAEPKAEEGRELTEEDSFTWKQLEGGRVHFQHFRDKSRSGEFLLRAADPQLLSQSQSVQVQAVSMQPPRVLTLAPLLVDGPGATATLTKSVLLVDDPDNPADVLVMVLEPPGHGRLTRVHGDRVLGRFKLDELSREQVQYVHDGSGAAQDHMVLQVNDGHAYQNILLRVLISQEAWPHLRSVPHTWVKEGGMVRLNRKYLRAHFLGVSADHVLYTILTSHAPPRYGEVVLVSMPADGPPEGWSPSEERGYTSTTSFTQQDVDDGTVWYRHFGHGTTSDSFQFQVSSEAPPIVQTNTQTFQVGVLPQNPEFPQLDPDCGLQVMAVEDGVTEITSSALSFMDSETSSEDLIYNITKPLPAGQGTIEHRERPHVSVQHFSQADVDQHKILYRPPRPPSHLQELYQYSFIGLPESLSVYFTVSDGQHTTPELDFAIQLLSNHQQPPMFQVLDPLLEVGMGGQTPVGVQHLAVSDVDTPPDELEFEVVDAPHHGHLVKTQDGRHATMDNGDVFTFSDVTHNNLLYRHAGLSSQEDAITFSVSDGIAMATTVVRVAVSGARDDGPQRDPASSLSLEVGKRSSTVIRRSHLAYTDTRSSDDEVRVQLVSVPMYGVLTRTLTQHDPQPLREFSTFTMEDINLNTISYVTTLETGDQPVTDVFHFVVYDSDNHRLDNQMLTITITPVHTPVHARVPVVSVGGAIKVQEGGRVQLSTNHISVSEQDTPRKNLQVWLLRPPKYGFIENTKPGGSVGVAQVITADAPFSVDDLASDHIFYVQSEGQQSQRDDFSFYVSDGLSQTEALDVEIHIQVKQQSELVVSVSSVHVEENSGVVITNSSLSVMDHHTPDHLIFFTLLRQPSYGKLRRRQFYAQPLDVGRVLTPGSTFTYQDVLERLLVYTPDTVSGGSDEMALSVSDGVHTRTLHLQVTMDVTRTEGPRMTVNRGLQLPAGSSSKISEQNLKASDLDSDVLKLRYLLTKDPPSGQVLLSKNGRVDKVTVKGPTSSFTQEDVNKGEVQYSHLKGEKGGSLSFNFNLLDPEGNKLIDQSFYISVLEDRLPPRVEVNKGLVLDENSWKKLTTMQLSASDQDSEPSELVFHISKQTSLGHLEHAASPGSSIDTFRQSDLVSRSIQYVHSSQEEKHDDSFSFSVSDGTNEVAQTFYISIRPVDDSLPRLHVAGMTVQEGVRKTITEFEMKATDADTQAESIMFRVVQPPRHGTIERTNNGQHYRQTSSFSMDDVYQNRVSYNHDGSNSLKDRFSFTVADGTNLLFMVEDNGKEIVTAAPQKFNIDILPVDDGTPRIVTNLGLQWLDYLDNKASNLITKKELLTMDPDTEDEQLVYEVTSQPKHGFLESKGQPGSRISTFSQADINLGLIRYVLHEDSVQETMDTFKFLVKDSKPNVVRDNVFHVQWSLISFLHQSYNVTEEAGTVAVTVKRTGNLNQYAIVLCRTEQGSATSSSSTGQQDYVEYAGQVQFDEREDVKVCTIVINDDKVFEGMESFQVELSMPVYALLGGNTRAVVNINDTEDEPKLQFDQKIYHVNESTGVIQVPIERKGDTSSTVWALCYTVAKSAQGSSPLALESGSDYKSRGMSPDNRVVLGPGVSMSTCDVRLIDDSEYELSEEFQLVLSDASDNARMGDVTVAKVVIDGPNDASTVSLGNATFTFSEDAGTIEIPVLRHGSDLSSVTSVWCATRPADPPSASPGVDYIPSSKKVEFQPGKTDETCSLTIMDDVQNPSIEGSESFVVFLSSPQGAVLQEPYEASVVIIDTFQDIPSMQFEKSAYTVKERDGALHIPVIRTGDLSYKSSVRCFTRTMSAMVMDDFEERRNVDEFRITFLRGDKVKNCTVHVMDDSVFEPEEEFQVHLGTPLGDHWSGAMIGERDVVTITITNDEDAPTIEFEQASFQVREPPGPDGIEVLNIKVIRHGDLDRTSKIRCSTRDGSAQSGVDYNPRSRVLKFTPGMDHILFKVEIVSNEDREWHESFTVVLGPDDPVEAVLGEITMATVTILDQEAAGSLILPAPPLVVSLADYDHVQEVTKEGSKKTPSPGYPLVCVTPCDPHYPKYSLMKERCEEAGINQTQVHFSWEVAAPTDTNGARSPFETVTDTTPYTSVNHMVLDSIYFSRRFHVRCVAQARDKAGHLGTPLRSNIATIGTEGSICHTPVTTGTARGFQAQSFIATLKYLDVKHKEHPNRIHISVQIPHQDGMLPLVSTMPLHNLHFLLSESIYRQQHVCSNLVTLKDLQGLSETGFLDDVSYDSISLGPGYDRPYQFNPGVREARSIQLYKHLNLKSCIWTFDAFYDMTELIDVCGGSVTADFQVRDSAQSFLTVQVPLYVSYIYVTAPRGWASLEHHTEMDFSFFYDTVLWRTGIQTDSVLSARLQIIRIYIRQDGRLVIDFKTHAKFRGQFVPDHHTLPGHKSHLLAPDHLGGMDFDIQLLWSAQTFDSPYQLWRATSSYSRKDYSGEYTVLLIPCTVQPTQPWMDPGDKPLSCTAHAPEKFLVPIAFQQTNRPVPVVYSLNTEFQLCNNEKVFTMDPASADVSMAEMDYKGAFSMGQTLYGRVLWNPDQNLNAAYRLQLEKVYLCTGKDGYVPFFDPTGTLYNEGPQYGCIQNSKNLKHRFLVLDRKQPDVCHEYFHDVPFEANFASDVGDLSSVSAMPGVDGFVMKVDALYKVEAGHQWYLQVIYVIGPESRSGPRIRRSLTSPLARPQRDLAEVSGHLALDESLIYDNEGDQVKNGTNMKSLRLASAAPAGAFTARVGSSVGGGVAALALLVLVLLASCFLFRRHQRRSATSKGAQEDYPLNTKVQVCLDRCVEKKFSSCTVTNVNVLHRHQQVGKVKEVNLEVKLHNNLHDGTEV